MCNDFKNIAIWGYGKEGASGHNFLKNKYGDCHFTIIDVQKPGDMFGADYLPQEGGVKKISDGEFDLILKSPGISLYHEAVWAAKGKGTVFTSGTNLWFEAYPQAFTVAVTGTKGKSSTASLVHHMLKACGLKSVLAGNIGSPLLDHTPGEDITVMELSSYQISDLTYAPDIAVLTNLYSAHAQWHGGLKTYHDDKMRLFFLSEDTLAIVANDDERAKKYLGDKEKVLFFGGNTGTLDIPESLNKPHQIRNISAALSVIEAIGEMGHLPENALSDYTPLPHRQEVVGIKDGVTFINDSIATIPESAIAALESFSGKSIRLILGGKEEGQDYRSLYDAISKTEDIQVFCIPGNGKRIFEELQNTDIHTVFAQDLEEAVDKASCAPAGGVVLLSPAAPSYDCFKNFEERGEAFRKLCGF